MDVSRQVLRHLLLGYLPRIMISSSRATMDPCPNRPAVASEIDSWEVN
jgi:hypothetical protein